MKILFFIWLGFLFPLAQAEVAIHYQPEDYLKLKQSIIERREMTQELERFLDLAYVLGSMELTSTKAGLGRGVKYDGGRRFRKSPNHFEPNDWMIVFDSERDKEFAKDYIDKLIYVPLRIKDRFVLVSDIVKKKIDFAVWSGLDCTSFVEFLTLASGLQFWGEENLKKFGDDSSNNNLYFTSYNLYAFHYFYRGFDPSYGTNENRAISNPTVGKLKSSFNFAFGQDVFDQQVEKGGPRSGDILVWFAKSPRNGETVGHSVVVVDPFNCIAVHSTEPKSLNPGSSFSDINKSSFLPAQMILENGVRFDIIKDPTRCIQKKDSNGKRYSIWKAWDHKTKNFSVRMRHKKFTRKKTDSLDLESLDVEGGEPLLSQEEIIEEIQRERARDFNEPVPLKTLELNHVTPLQNSHGLELESKENPEEEHPRD